METEKTFGDDEILKLSSVDKEEPKNIDLNQKMVFAYDILQECIKEKEGNISNCLLMKQLLNNFFKLTNNKNSKLINTLFEKEKTYKCIQTDANPDDETLDNLDFAIRRVLINSYVNCKEIPTMEFIKNMIGDTVATDLTRENIKKCGYIWKRLGKTKRTILMEHPKQNIQRQQYLLQLNRYREQKRFVVYADVKIMDKSNANVRFFKNNVKDQNPYVVFLAVASNKGYIGGTTCTCTSILKCQESIEEYFIANILPCLNEPSVIILEDNPYFRKSLPVPTIESEKCAMLKWLNNNRIPHEESCHRSDLFELIQKCKNKVDLHKFDTVLRANGHEILRRPARTSYLNFYKPLWDNVYYLLSTTKKDDNISKLMTEKPQSYWEVLENHLISLEKVVYAEDSQIENVIDKVLTMAQTVNVDVWADVECDLEDDSLNLEEYLVVE